MMPSMFSGVSGLRNHQVRLNVIGNNLANVNTIGYKYSRANFADMMYQNLKSASAPQNGLGGVNPQQIGLGMTVSSIDTVQTGGNLEATGRTTDMAIQGDGFFILGDGVNQYYTRAGAFDLNGALLNPGNGLYVQGWAATNGAVDTSGALTRINIPLGERMKAQATSQVTYVGNLNASGSTVLGTITQANQMLASAATDTLLTGLRDSAGNNLGIQAGNTITISGSVGAAPISASYVVNSASDLTALATALEDAIQAASSAGETVTVGADGQLVVSTSGADITGLKMEIAGNTLFTTAMTFDTPITDPGGGVSGTGSSDTLRKTATGTDLLVNLCNAGGTKLGLANNDDITLMSAMVGGSLKSDVPVLTNINAAAATVNDYLTGLRTALFGATPLASQTVSLDSTGHVVITGAPGAANAVTGLELGAGPNPGDDTRIAFKAAQSYTETQKAVDAASYRIATQAFDSLGQAHDIDVTFTKMANNTWDWSATDPAGAGVGGGTLIFSSAGGTLLSASGSITIPVTNGAVTPIEITPDFSALNQLGGQFSVSLRSQNGYPMGALDKYEISSTGVVTGIFSNGLNEVLGQIALARFSNPGGLNKQGDNMFSQSTNSGIAQVGTAGSAGRGTIATSNLEMSNVDIAREFTSMIISQRGFQANSKVITTSDEMLQELVNLKR